VKELIRLSVTRVNETLNIYLYDSIFVSFANVEVDTALYGIICISPLESSILLCVTFAFCRARDG
jgi:hypothetical protein